MKVTVIGHGFLGKAVEAANLHADEPTIVYAAGALADATRTDPWVAVRDVTRLARARQELRGRFLYLSTNSRHSDLYTATKRMNEQLLRPGDTALRLPRVYDSVTRWPLVQGESITVETFVDRVRAAI